jgi:hypothetical protein
MASPLCPAAIVARPLAGRHRAPNDTESLPRNDPSLDFAALEKSGLRTVSPGEPRFEILSRRVAPSLALALHRLFRTFSFSVAFRCHNRHASAEVH